MSGYEDRFNAMQAAQDAMKTGAAAKKLKEDIKSTSPIPDFVKKPLTAEQDIREMERLRRVEEKAPTTRTEMGKKKGGKVCGMKKGGKVRGCGCAKRGLTKGRMV